MQATDANKFRDIMRGMCKLFAQEPDAVLLDAYWLALRSWDFHEFEAAAAHLMGTSKFMPRPADFNELRKANRPTSSEAWLKARASCSTAYTPRGYVGGTSGDPLIDKAVQVLGGYGVIALCDLDKLQFLEKRFNEAYESMQDAQDVRVSLPHLGNGAIGLAEINKRLEERNKIKLLQGKPAA